MIYVFDGSLNGLLSAIFYWFEQKPKIAQLKCLNTFQPDAFAETINIHTDIDKADRVWQGLHKKLQKDWLRKFYCAYLSENDEIFNHLFLFGIALFQNKENISKDYGNEQIIQISKMARSVEREKHRMEAFIRFQETQDRLFYATIDPDFNVLPLISNHFKNRYADQQWVIYDLKRKYGLFYNLNTVDEITFSFNEGINKHKPDSSLLADKEENYTTLWKDYFNSVNIKARKNTKLHIQHVPKRYWKYLTEKQV
jgi:probable DNA metabolism protein